MEVIYGSLVGVLAILGALVFAFFRGRSTGTRTSEAEQNTRKLEEIEAQRVIVDEIKVKIQEAENATNSEDRNGLLAALTGDSLRDPKARRGL